MILTKVSPNEAGQRFDKYLKKLLKNASDSFIYKMLRKKNIILNGKKADGKEKLCVDDEIKFFFADETFEKFSGKSARKSIDPAQYIHAYQKLDALQIIYEDDNILIVDKPSGILSQKSRPEDLSANEWLTGYLLSRHEITADSLATFKPSVCNRLDRNTSGMVACGKTLAGSQYLSRIIRDKTLEKYYYCLVAGGLTVDERVSGYLYKDTSQNKVTIYHQETDIPDSLRGDAVYIDTAFRSIRTARNITLLEVQIFTGKTHQIRAHLSALGYPIIGDSKYGDAAVNQMYFKKGVRFQLLHAHKLIFPETTEQQFSHTSGMIVECPPPAVFNELMK